MEDIRCILFIATGWNPSKAGGAGLDTVYFGTHGFVSDPSDTPASTFFEPRIANPGAYVQSMYAEGTTGGNSAGGYGVVELINIDSQLDYLIDWGFGGRDFLILEGPRHGSLAQYSVIMSGTVEQPEHNWFNLSFRFRDNVTLLEKPIALNYYLGTNVLPDGLEGTSDIAGKEKPRLFGRRDCETPVLVNTSRLIYQVNDGLLSSITNVRDKGVVLTAGVSRTYTEIQAAGSSKVFTHAAVPVSVIDSVDHGFVTGTLCKVYSTTSLPTPLSSTPFYYIRSLSADTFSFHNSYAEAVANTGAISLTVAGAGTFTVTDNLTAPGKFDWCFDARGSYIRLGSAPAGQVTFGGIESTKTIAETMKALALERISYTYGPNIAINGTFVDGANWIGDGFERGWVIGGGVATSSGEFGYEPMEQTPDTIQANKWYEVRFTITAISSGSCRAVLAATGTGSGTPRTAVGTYSEVLYSETSGSLIFNSGGEAFIGSLANVQLREVTQIRKDMVVEQSILDTNVAYPSTVVWGHYTGQKNQTTKDVLDIISKAGIWWGFDNLGKFWAKQFAAATSANPILTLTSGDMLSVDRLATQDTGRGVPVWKVICRYQETGTVQQELAGTVYVNDPASVLLLTSQWREAAYTDPNDGTLTGIRNKHPLAETMVIDTPFNNYVDALAEATRQFNLRSVRRDRLKISIANTPDGPNKYNDSGYWDDEAITEMPISLHLAGVGIDSNYLYMFNRSNTNQAYLYRLNMDNPTGVWEKYTNSNPPRTSSYSGYHGCAVYGGYFYLIGTIQAYETYPDEHSTWRLNLSNLSNTWDDASVPNLPAGEGRGQAACVMWGSKLIVMQGRSYLTFTNRSTTLMLDLDNMGAGWSYLPSFPTGNFIQWNQYTIYNDILYVMTGSTSNPQVYMLDLNNPVSWVTTGITQPPTHPTFLGGGGSFMIGSKWILFGSGNTYNFMKCISIDLDNPTGRWIFLADLPDGGRSWCVGASYKGAGYAMGGWNATSVPGKNSWRLRYSDNPEDKNQLTSIGRSIIVKQPRYGYDSGRPMTIIGNTTDHKTKQIELELWG